MSWRVGRRKMERREKEKTDERGIVCEAGRENKEDRKCVLTAVPAH